MISRIPLLSIVLLSLLLLGCAGCTDGPTSGYVPLLEITGDVEEPIALRSLRDGDMEDFRKNDRTYRGVGLQGLLESAVPLSEEYTLLLVAADGRATEVGGAILESSYLVHSDDNGWEAVHLHRPPSAGVQHLHRIVVVSAAPDWSDSVNVIRLDRNLIQLTPGQLYKSGLQEIPVLEGESAQAVEEQASGVTMYTRRLGAPVTDVLGYDRKESFMVIGRQGKVEHGEKDGFLQWCGNTLRYVSKDGRQSVDDVVGIFLDPPAAAITDLHSHVVRDLDDDEKVLVIMLDGLGYHQYQAARVQGFIPFMGRLDNIQPALVAYRPVTNAGLASIMTGTWPHEHGVFFRERELAVPTFFQHVLDSGKRGVLLQGSLAIIQTEIDPVLHVDADGSGDEDDEIFASAMNQMQDPPALLMVHFKSIDYVGHRVGDMHPDVMDAIRRNDDYVKELVEAWSGPVYILADHGMHTQGDEGVHGAFRYEDMVVPFIIAKGGQRL